jgi:hypothetical protein
MDCCLPADFFLADDARRVTHGDYELGADAHVHIDSPAFVTGLRDWKHDEVSRPRGPYPGPAKILRGEARVARRGIRQAHPERVGQPVDAEWRPL